MGILNRRNAFLGWLIWLAIKVVAKNKAKSAVPGSSGRGFGISAVVFAFAAATGAAWLFLRRRRHGSSSPGE